MISIDTIISQALNEDIGSGDHSALACIPADAQGTGVIVAKEPGIIAGIEVAKLVFKQLDPTLEVTCFKTDGDTIATGDAIIEITGKSRSILSGERLALNFMQRMSGIATITNELQNMVSPFGCKVLDTRKTTPGLRHLEKLAVKIGGGTNHRMGLYDMMMIKDNHIDYAGSISKAIEMANVYRSEKGLPIQIEIEARNIEEVEEILHCGKIERIMLDNFSIPELKKAVALINKKYRTEASGGITKQTIVEYAKTGVDYISIGALTHSVKSIDLSLLAKK